MRKSLVPQINKSDFQECLMQHVSPSLPLTKGFVRLTLALLITAAAAPAFAEDSIYLSSFEASEIPPAAAWSFDNVTTSSLEPL